MNCIHPTVISDGKGSRRLVPCGKCAWCRKKKRDEWFVRFLAESLKTPCYFLTLTYDDEWLPVRFVDLNTGETFVFRGLHDDYITEDFARIGSVPYLDDWQKYMKRVRKDLDLPKGLLLKFFFVSEYGHLHGRVHYHALVWCEDDSCMSVLVDQWPFGDSYCDPAGIGSMKYVTKYILKGSDAHSLDLRDDNLKTQSAGIGSDLWPKLIRFYTSDNYEATFQWFGSYHAFPHYYKKKIREFLDNQSDFVDIQVTKDSKGEWKVKNLHCKFVQELDRSRSLPEINDNDILHQLMRNKVSDLNETIYHLYMKDYNKQFEINSKTNILFNQ